MPRSPLLDVVEESDVSTDSISLSWGQPQDSTQDYTSVMYIDISVPTTIIQSKQVNFPGNSVFLGGLLPGHNYSITISAVSGNTPSKAAEIYENTSKWPKCLM